MSTVLNTSDGAPRPGEAIQMQNHNSRVGLLLFTIYLILYVGFVYLNAFATETMEATPMAGVNLAILYGFGLIIAAFVLAMIYGFVARTEPDESTKEDQG